MKKISELKKGMRKVSTDIASWNFEDEIREYNLQTRHVAAVPLLGIFWIDVETSEIYEKTIGIREAPIRGTNKVYPGTHSEEWGEIQKKNRKWIGKYYMSVPRGRVTLYVDPEGQKFVVNLPPEFENNDKIKEAVLSKFNLPSPYVVWEFDDPHYKVREPVSIPKQKPIPGLRDAKKK